MVPQTERIAMDQPDPQSRMNHSIARGLLVLGLIICAISFVMLDREWLKEALPAVGPIQHSAALITGALGLATLLLAAYRLRRATSKTDEP